MGPGNGSKTQIFTRKDMEIVNVDAFWVFPKLPGSQTRHQLGAPVRESAQPFLVQRHDILNVRHVQSAMRADHVPLPLGERIYPQNQDVYQGRIQNRANNSEVRLGQEGA